MTKITAFLNDETGVSATEYVLLLAIIGAGIITGVKYLGGSINSALHSAGDAIKGLGFTAL